MVKATIQEIMRRNYEEYERCHPLPGYVRKAARALINCRTAVLGGHVQACPEGDYERHWYNSCRHRICPQCHWLQLEAWLQKQSRNVLPCGHYHLIFTLPHELNDLWLLNVRAMTDLFFTCMRDTLFEFFLDPKHVGAKPAVIAALHTWTKTMLLHPHLHCLIADGGLEASQWIASKNGYLLPIRAVMAVFRGKFLNCLDRAVDKATITLPEEMSHQQFKNLKNKLGRVKWNVHIRERYDHGKGVLTYLARYLRGGAMSNRRIISSTEERITFMTRKEPLTLTFTEFIQRYLLHVPEPRTKVVRYYGLYAPTAKTELSLCRELLGADTVTEPDTVDWCRRW